MNKKITKIIKHLFVPHRANAFRPHALRHKTLSVYSLGLILSQLFFGATLYAGPIVFAGDTSAVSQNILTLSNKKRQSARLGILTKNGVLDRAAQLKLKDMTEKNYWDHTGPNGETAWDFINEAGYRYSLAGENLARGFSNSASVVGAWMASSTHRANILNGRFKEMGIAVGSGKIGGNSTTIIVQIFGEPKTIFAGRGAEDTSVLGEKKIIPEVSLANATVPSKIPYFASWLLIFALVIMDGVMIRRLKLHTSKAHIFDFRVSLFCVSAVLVMLTFGFAAIA